MFKENLLLKNKEFRRNDRILESSEVLSSENSESVKIESSEHLWDILACFITAIKTKYSGVRTVDHSSNANDRRVGQFWGKYDSITGGILSLTAHCIDVAFVFRELCNITNIERSLANATTTKLKDVHLDRLAVLAMFHDIGKANLGFQDKVFIQDAPKAGHINELAPLLGEENLLTNFLESLPPGIDSWFSDPKSADSYFYAVFSHHGRPVRFLNTKDGRYWVAKDKWWHADAIRDPFAAIADISHWAQKVFPNAFNNAVESLPAEPRFHHRFAGLVMLADWLGSHKYWFPVKQMSIEERIAYVRKTASKMLRAIGFDVTALRPILASIGDSFKDLFTFTPWPLQRIIEELDIADPRTRLIIAESETGSGKTEAALHWFCKLFASGKVDSLYFALPTRVAAVGLYDRIANQIKKWFPDPDYRPVILLAVPGYAQVDGQPVNNLIPDYSDANLYHEEADLIWREKYWAGEAPKRFLAATVAVGTIDQALLSVVQTSHAHLRSVCLDRSLLVVDEVHASDTYMSALLRTLLQHHLGVGGYTMLLSATLGSNALHQYVKLSNPHSTSPFLQQASAKPYPSVTLSDGFTIPASKSQRTKEVDFELREYAFCPERIVDEAIVPALQAGARVLAIMNTVDRAVNLLKQVENNPAVKKDWLFKYNEKICPHHGRFAPADRLILDRAVVDQFGKESSSGALLLVGTQTLEQSLDIDADIMITDLAPVDVLLQRVGRLHRHRRPRPAGYDKARCIVFIPDQELESSLTRKGEVSGRFKRLGYGSVYEDLRTLELTLNVLREKPHAVIPNDNRFYVEKATHPELLASLAGPCWREHSNRVSGISLAKVITADAIASKFNSYFGEVTFSEQGISVTTRLGIDQFKFRLSSTVISPFGQVLKEITIPGHMAPELIDDEMITVERLQNDGTILLCCGDRQYLYGRYGLEAIS